jgi:CcmD family protein
MNKLKAIILTICFSSMNFLIAEESEVSGSNPVSDAATNMLRGNAKFNVVAAVLVLIFIGIVLYLIRLDRKMTKLEKQINQK